MKVEQMVPAQVVILAKFCHSAMLILNARLFTLLGMLLSAGLFSWVLWEPDWIRFAGAVAFSLLVFWPLQHMEAQARTDKEKQLDSD